LLSFSDTVNNSTSRTDRNGNGNHGNNYHNTGDELIETAVHNFGCAVQM